MVDEIREHIERRPQRFDDAFRGQQRNGMTATSAIDFEVGAVSHARFRLSKRQPLAMRRAELVSPNFDLEIVEHAQEFAVISSGIDTGCPPTPVEGC